MIRDSTFIEIYKGDTVKIQRKNSDKIVGYICSDATNYIISSKAFYSGMFYKDKTLKQDSLISTYKALTENLRGQTQLLNNLVTKDSVYFVELISLSKMKDKIAQDAIDELRKREFIQLAFQTLLGGAAGALWITDNDNGTTSLLKVAGLAATTLAVSISFDLY